MPSSIFPTDAEARELLVGPDSVTWRRTSDVRLYLVALYPLLLQVAHPTVAAGVRDFSDFERRPWDRLMRTLDYVALLVYGGPEAVAAGRRLRAMHKSFRGTRDDGQPYYALEPEAYAWVHATLLATYVAGHAHFGRPMRREEKERFYREYRGLGRLIGVREESLPPDWTSFERYFERTSRELEPTPQVERVLSTVGHATPPVPLPDIVWRAVRLPASRALWVGGIGLMDPALRRRLGIRWGVQDEAAYRLLGLLGRGVDPLLPTRLRVTGPAQLRWRERAIATGPLGPGEKADVAAA